MSTVTEEEIKPIHPCPQVIQRRSFTGAASVRFHFESPWYAVINSLRNASGIVSMSSMSTSGGIQVHVGA
jgi:hypothetical protein